MISEASERQLTTPIASRIAAATAALLPDEIASDDNAKWIVSFDALVHGKPTVEDARRTIVSPHEAESVHAEVFEQLIAMAAVPRLSFYFASLFHIGSIWRRAQRSSQECEDLLSDERGMRVSVDRIVRVVGRNKRDAVRRFLTNACTTRISDNKETLSKLQRRWNDWRAEVEPQRRAISALTAHHDHDSGHRLTLCVEAYRAILTPSLLQEAFRHEGVVFNTPYSIDMSSAVLSSLIATSAVAAAAAPGRYYYDFRETARRMLEAPAVTAGVNVLRERYGDRDPFQIYYPVRKPANETLVDLIAENTLAEDVASPWLAQWRAAIDRAPDKEMKLGRPENISMLSDWVASSADSTLKYGLLRHHVGAPLSDHLQRVFEDDWIEALAVATAPRNDRHEDFVWDLDSFTRLVELALDTLRFQGYKVISPQKSRLRRLFELRTVDTARWNKVEW